MGNFIGETQKFHDYDDMWWHGESRQFMFKTNDPLTQCVRVVVLEF